MNPLNRFPPRQVIYLAGVARSGTSWIGQIFNSVPNVRFRFQPLFAYEFKNQVNEESPRESYERLFLDMHNSDSPFLSQTGRQDNGEYPTFEKDEAPDVLAFKENRYQSIIEPMLRRVPCLQAVGIVRHPCAVLNSWRKNPKEFPAGSDILKEWRFGNCKNKGNEDYFGYYRWKEVAHLYLDLKEKYPDRFALLHYERAVQDPAPTIRELFEFLGLDFTPATRSFLDRSTSTHDDSYYAVFKNKDVAERWRQELPSYIADEIYADLAGTRLEQFL